MSNQVDTKGLAGAEVLVTLVQGATYASDQTLGIIKCMLEKKPFCPRMYDRVHGPGAAAEAIEAISVLQPSLSSNTKHALVHQ
jgi:hypothetical protein